MAATYTLNQLTGIIRSLGMAHAQLNTVAHCTLDELLSRQEVRYPAMCYEVSTAPVSGRKERFPFRIWLIDLALPGEDAHASEIRSDMLSVSSDLIAMLMNEQLFDFGIEDGIDRQIIGNATDSADGTTGVMMTLTISQTLRLNRCAVPVSGVFRPQFSKDFS